MKKFIIVLLLVISFTLVGCDNKKVIEGETIEVVHSKGKVNVTTDIKKAVVFDYGILDIMDNLGIEVELAVPNSNLPAYLNKYANTFNVGTLTEPNLEKVYEFAPDVIIISGRQEAMYEDLNEIAPTIYVEIDSTKFISDLEKNVNMVSKLFHAEEKAQELIEEIAVDINEVTALTKDLTKNALVVLVNGNTMSAYGPGSRFGLVHDVLGIIAADTSIQVSTHGQQITYEYISSKNPDFIFVVDRASVVTGTPSSNLFDNVMMENVKAYKSDDIHFLNAAAWYLVSGGITSTKQMIKDIKDALVK